MMELTLLFAKWIAVALMLAWLALCIIRPAVAPATFEVLLRAARWLYAASHGYCEFMELLRAQLPLMLSRARWVTRTCYTDITSGMEQTEYQR